MARKSRHSSSTRVRKSASDRTSHDTISFRRRLGRWALRAVVLGALVLAGASVYYYNEASTTLDQWLEGTKRRANPSYIYAAPMSLRVGQGIGPAQIVDYLRQASYVEFSHHPKPGRSVFRRRKQSLEIMPGKTAVFVRQRVFPHLQITFDKKEEQIEQIIDVTRHHRVETGQLEPVLLSTITRLPGRGGAAGERGIRYDVSYDQIPVHLVDAVIAVEDRSFFEHTGINLLAILRAFWRNLRHGNTVQGGSTITQQLVKNILVGPERTYRRKIREAFIALALESRLTKEEIFARYANVIYMGHRGGLSIYGLGAAAREYFGKDISQLTLAEAALLAGMIHRPAYYLARGRRADALKRRSHVLDAMVAQGMISRSEAEAGKLAPLKIRIRPGLGDTDVTTPYFLDYVQEAVLRLAPETDLAQAGYRIYSTLDPQIQRAASVAVADGLAMLDRRLRRRKPAIPAGMVQAALVALDAHSGRILAMVGGRDYSESQFNRVTDALRQPGSAIKPFVYAAALSSGVHDGLPITLASLYADEPRRFEQDYTPRNFGGRYLGRPVTVREALVRSLNVVTVELAQETGYGEVAGMIGRCGLPRPPANASIALGTSEVSPLELASAYTAFVAGGRRSRPMCIQRIMGAHGSTLRQIQSQYDDVMSPQVAFLVLSALRDVIKQPYGTGHAASALSLDAVAGKTGTSQRSDAWFVGLTPGVVTVTWVGFDDNRPLGLTGSRAALPIWVAFMKQVARLRPDLLAGRFDPPEGLVERPIDPTTGLLATRRCPTHKMEFFLEGREVLEFCTEHPGPALEEPAETGAGPHPDGETRRQTRPRRITPARPNTGS